MAHECIIGLLHHCDYSELVTLADLKRHIEDNIEYNKTLDDDPLLKDAKELKPKCWTLKSYGDKRKSTDLTRFDYCPQCGKKINWIGAESKTVQNRRPPMTDRIDEIRARYQQADQCEYWEEVPSDLVFMDIPYLLGEIDRLNEAHEPMLRDLQMRSAQVEALERERDEYKVALQNWHEGE